MPTPTMEPKPQPGMDDARLTPALSRQLRSLAHDLSNSLETVLQAAYLLGQADLGESAKKWAQLIDTAAREAARTNRELRELLRRPGE